MQKFLIAPCNLLIFNKKARSLLKAGNKSVTKRTKSSRLAGFLTTKVANLSRFSTNTLSSCPVEVGTLARPGYPILCLVSISRIVSNSSSGIALKSGCLLCVLTFTSFWKSPVIACCLGIT